MQCELRVVNITVKKAAHTRRHRFPLTGGDDDDDASKLFTIHYNNNI